MGNVVYVFTTEKKVEDDVYFEGERVNLSERDASSQFCKTPESDLTAMGQHDGSTPDLRLSDTIDDEDLENVRREVIEDLYFLDLLEITCPRI